MIRDFLSVKPILIDEFLQNWVGKTNFGNRLFNHYFDLLASELVASFFQKIKQKV
jgi:hypothetical protein